MNAQHIEKSGFGIPWAIYLLIWLAEIHASIWRGSYLAVAPLPVTHNLLLVCKGEQENWGEAFIRFWQGAAAGVGRFGCSENCIAGVRSLVYPSCMSETCKLVNYFLLSIPFLIGLNLARSISSKGWTWAALAALCVYQLIMFTTPLVLGHLGILQVVEFRTVLVSIGAFLTLRGIFCLKPLAQAVRCIRYRPRFIDLLILAAAYLFFLNGSAQLIDDYSTGSTEFDPNNYHIPRALIWLLHGNFAAWGAATWQQIALSPGGTASLVPTVFMGCGFLGAGHTGTFYALGAGLGVIVIAQALGLSTRAGVLGALAFLSFPTIGFRFSAVSTDMAGSFPVIAATAFFLCTSDRARGFFLFISLCGLGIASKQYVASSVAPIGALFVLLHLRHLFTSRRMVGACAVGLIVAASLILLSLWPVYQTFGDFQGGDIGAAYSTFPHGSSAVVRSLTYGFVHWLSEPLSLLPEGLQQEWFKRLRIDKMYEVGGIIAGKEFIPHFNRNESRSGLLPFLALPWLVFGVRRGYRLLTFVGFLVFVACQVGTIHLNLTGRFVIVPLAAFAVLWAVRAQTQMTVVALCVLVAHVVNRHELKVQDYLPKFSSIHYEVGRGECHELRNQVGDDVVLVVTRPLAVDSFIAGRDGRVKFDYVWCPEDGDWVKHLKSLGERYKWIVFSTHVTEWTPGPWYSSVIKFNCGRKPLTNDDLRGLLTAAGWRFGQKLECLHELWTTTP